MSSKRSLLIAGLVVVLGAIGYFSYDMYADSQADPAAEAQAQVTRQTLPSAMLQTTGGGTFELANVPKGRPVVLMFFKPTCPYCQEETVDIKAHGQLTDEATVLMVSTFNRSSLQAYAQEYGLNGMGNVRVLRDFGGSLFTQYNISSVPHTFVYDAQHNLVRDFKGKASADRLYAAATNGPMQPASVTP